MKRFSVDQSQCGIAIYPLQMQHDKSNEIVTFCVDASAKATTSALTVGSNRLDGVVACQG